MEKEQYVCTVCGFNMVGHHPAKCPFCGAPQRMFLTWQECSERYRVVGKSVTPRVTQLCSTPQLGYEHAAYRLETGGKTFWIDCPSCFDPTLEPVDVISFTHHHFLGASNLYREHFPAEVQINGLDAENEIASRFPFDNYLSGDFADSGLEAFHVDGHTSGFTVYVFDGVLFVCDYVFAQKDGMKFNPYGPQERTRARAERIREIAESNNVSFVCGYTYVKEYKEWREGFSQLLRSTG